MKIISARYAREFDKYDQSELICKMEGGSEKIFHFHSSNPMPKIEYFLGETWDYLVGMCKGMWYMKVDIDCRLKCHHIILKGE